MAGCEDEEGSTMSDDQKAREEEVFDQELSLDELDAAAGGTHDDCGGIGRSLGCRNGYVVRDSDQNNCTKDHYRQIYGGGGFPNCAATVEDGSWCGTNDACYDKAVEYQGRTDCKKAWR